MIIKAWVQRRAARRIDAVRVQEATLLRLLKTCSRTAFGKQHGFASIGSVAEYQARVPVRRYEDFFERWWKPNFPYYQNGTWPGLIPYLAESSGTTTGRTKYLPVSQEMIRGNQAAAADVLAFHLAARPQSRLLGGRTLMLGGSTALRRMGPGVRSGDLSGIAAVTMPWWARRRSWPPRDIALLPKWDEKLDRLAAGAIGQDIRGLSGTPSWLLVLFERLSAKHPDHPRTLAGIFPRLELVIHGGVGFAPYEAAFRAWLEGSAAEHREVYAASEGFVAAADRAPGEGLRLMLDHGLFFEFIRIEAAAEKNPHRFWIGDAEPGRDYALALTSNAGAWSMLIGDRVRLLDGDPPRILVTGRLGLELSLFGEHVIGAELDRAIEAGAAACGCAIADYTAHPFLRGDGRGRHLFAVEPASGSIDPARFGMALDRNLRAGNADYDAHRSGNVQLLPPLIHPLPAGSFAQWMRQRHRLGGQNKVPRVIADQPALADLLGLTPDALCLVLSGGPG